MASVKIGMEQASVSHLEQVLLEGDEDQNEVRGSRHSHPEPLLPLVVVLVALAAKKMRPALVLVHQQPLGVSAATGGSFRKYSVRVQHRRDDHHIRLNNLT